ncbi:MAG: hypothetical protein ACE37H_07820 [Phycisphaeraceae bacterium]
MRFLIEFATGKPTCGCLGNPNDVALCENEYPAEKRPLAHVTGYPDYYKHYWMWEIEENQRLRRLGPPSCLMVIVRNPIECIARHIGTEWDEPLVLDHALLWLSLIQYYHAFNRPKHMFLYERLIDPDQRDGEVAGILQFVNADTNYASRLMENLGSLFEICRRGTKRGWDGAISQDQSIFHSQRISDPYSFKTIVGRVIGDVWRGLHTPPVTE